MTVGECRKEYTRIISAFAPDDAAVLCDILLSSVLGCDRSALLLSLDREISSEDENKLACGIHELSMGVPVQYVIGSCYFMGREIKVGRGCFIPRYDTEFLAAAAIAALPVGGSFADICCGSGCISAALAQTLKPSKGYALELSPKAAAYAAENLSPFPSVEVLRFDALDDDDYDALAGRLDGGLDVVVCNPPYIPSADIPLLSAQVQYEPETALDGGEDGLKFYREIIRLAPKLLKDEGTVLFEVGINQSDDVCSLLEASGRKTARIKDDAGIERVVIGKKY